VIISLGQTDAAPASGHAAHGGHGAGHGTGHAEVKSPASGVFLGEFQVRAYYPIESQKSTISFSLYATVTGDHLEQSQRLLVNRKHKARDRVILTTRLVPLADFDDPELTSFRRRIVVQLRRVLPELAIENVYVSDFELHVERIGP
jgi:hypothetical protein